MIDFGKLSFKSDPLSREQFAKNLMEIIKNGNSFSGDDSLSIALDSSWGTGKTYFLHMWKNWTDSDDYFSEANVKCRVVYYNAWENDDTKSAIIPIIYTIIGEFNDNSKIESSIKKASIQAGKEIFNHIIKQKFGIDILDILNAAQNGYKEKKDYFEDFKSKIDIKNSIQDELAHIVAANERLVVFVDELDRCRPTFAIETLEVIKHYFNIKGITFVFALDIQQLSHSVSTIYGQKMDSPGYLRRFFNYIAKMPVPTLITYIDFVLNLQKYLQIKSCRIIIHDLFSYFDFTLRDANIVINNFNLFYLTYKKYIDIKNQTESTAFIQIYLYFLILKYKHPNIYDIFMHQKYHWDDSTLRTYPEFMPVDKKFVKIDASHEFVNDYHKVATQHFPCQNKFKIYEGTVIQYLNLGDESQGMTVSQYIEQKLEFFDSEIQVG